MNQDRLIISNQEQFRQKAERRRELARLPVEEKLKRLIKLQAIAYNVGRQAGRQPRHPWGNEAKRLT